ncbi:MAG: hypothetical protein JSW39_10890 [Desulfobacterales bacterium]|nr:MAG: hypothetical protein JSW39_10890 [Desulfobacterales bacterium]
MPSKKTTYSGIDEHPDAEWECGDIESHETVDFEKIKVECLCPKCGRKHILKFPWTGRGIPRKYCPQCKGN